jgi:uncharacterized membrane protein YkvA (DUF1232 family)
MNWGLVILIVVLVFLVIWVTAAVVVRHHRPDRAVVPDAMELLPDIEALVQRLARDPATPRRTRLALRALDVWIRSPIDLIPDFLPAVGKLDDLIIGLAVLRRSLRPIEPDRVAGLWPGSAEGLDLFRRLLWDEAGIVGA